MMVDYSYYNGVYGGKLIEDPIDFRKLEFEATSLVDYYTMNRASRVNKENLDLLEKVKMTICFVIDELVQDKEIGLVTAVKIEGISTNYDSKSHRTSSVSDLIERMLGSTGLTYRGVMRCESYRQV